VATGIPPSVWADEGERAIATAVELLTGREPVRDHDGRQMRG
jgi:hypothetical protein